MEKKKKENHEFSGKAFIVFQTHFMAEIISDTYNSWFGFNKNKFRNTQIHPIVEFAPNPDEIHTENLYFDFFGKKKRRIFIFFIQVPFFLYFFFIFIIDFFILLHGIHYLLFRHLRSFHQSWSFCGKHLFHFCHCDGFSFQLNSQKISVQRKTYLPCQKRVF